MQASINSGFYTLAGMIAHVSFPYKDTI